ncbi:MMPL family transporter [Caldalkalibacillus mannanilyticus]|uniref:MMPL family transporter n=1 Tax=Caldalkalibacillus mannanilyticus TaxID=1418 RepID=UPI000ACD6303
MNSYIEWVAGKRGKWVTLLVWVALAVVLNMTLPQANKQVDDRASNFVDMKPSSTAAVIVEREFPEEQGLPALIVWHKKQGLEEADLQSITELASLLTDSPLPDQSMDPPLHQLPLDILKQQVSEDGTTLIMPVFFHAEVDAKVLKLNLGEMEERMVSITGENPFEAEIESGSLSARVTGPVGILIDATQLFTSGDFSLTVATFLFVLIVLLLIYRSPLLAVIPLIGVAFAYSILSPVLAG